MDYEVKLFWNGGLDARKELSSSDHGNVLSTMDYLYLPTCTGGASLIAQLVKNPPAVQETPELPRWHHPYGRKQRRTKEPLDENERGQWKFWLKTQHSENKDHGIWSHHFMEIDGDTVETVSDFIFLGSKSLQMVTAALKLKDTWSLEEKLWPT